MTLIHLSIEGDICGAMSVGTVAVIRALHKHLSLSLAEASRVVDRCVFEGEKLTLTAARSSAENLLAEFARLPAATRIHASISD